MTRSSGRSALVAVLGIVGVLALLAGAGLALLFGPQGHLQSKATRISGPGSAILGEGIEVDASSLPIPSGIGELTLDVSPVGHEALFVGTASQSDLDTYLLGAPYDVITSLPAGGTAQIRSVPGSDLPQSPEAQTFWQHRGAGAPGAKVSIVSARGSEASLVVMNRTPSNGVKADVVLTLTVGWSWATALVLMAVGAVALLIAIALAVRGRSARDGAPAVGAGSKHAAPGGGVPASTVLPGFDLPGSTAPSPDPGPAPAPGSATERAPVADTTGAGPSVVVPDAPQHSSPPG
ncbi:MAG TPA: hypothetical protein VIC82_13065 [Candidatus Nanopelagicales bacterium]